jgi:hypothetical protein
MAKLCGLDQNPSPSDSLVRFLFAPGSYWVNRLGEFHEIKRTRI